MLKTGNIVRSISDQGVKGCLGVVVRRYRGYGGEQKADIFWFGYNVIGTFGAEGFSDTGTQAVVVQAVLAEMGENVVMV